MLNPIYIPFAFMGGRSWGEIADCKQAKDMDTSITIGIGTVLSAAIILGGQNLYWQSIPGTAAVAGPIAAALTMVYSLFYRLIIRSSEVANWLGKILLYCVGFCLAGVNALLAGHELVLLPFGPQVQDMSVRMGQDNVSDLRSKTEQALGIGGLLTQAQQARQDEAQAQSNLNTVPSAIQTQQQQAQACDQRAIRMRAALPELDSQGHDRAYAAWQDQRRQCARLNASASAALAEHHSRASEALSAATKAKQSAVGKLNQAQGQSENAVTAAAPTLIASATTGFGRHESLWAAVREGKVPGWAVYGLMLVALLLEGAGLLLDLVLPKDKVACARICDTRITNAVADAELAYARAFKGQIRTAIRAQAPQTLAAAERLIDASLMPSMNTRIASEQFVRAADSTRDAQRRSRQAATPVIDELAKVMPGDLASGTA